MISELQVGPRVLTDGATFIQRGDREGSTVVTNGHARYAEAVRRGNVWVAANIASQVVTLGAATATGLILSNPAGSGKNLVVHEIIAYISAAITAVADIALFANVNPIAAVTTHTVPITPRNALLGASGAPSGLVDSSATLPAAPILVRPLFGWHWVTLGTTACQLGTKDEVAGTLIVSPGCAISVQGVTVVHSIIASFAWEEVPI